MPRKAFTFGKRAASCIIVVIALMPLLSVNSLDKENQLFLSVQAQSDDNASEDTYAPYQMTAEQLESINPNEYKGIIVKLEEEKYHRATNSMDSSSNQTEPLIRELAEETGMEITDQFAQGGEQYYLLEGEEYESAEIAEIVDYYNSVQGIEYAEPNFLVERDAIPNDRLFDRLWHFNNDGSKAGTLFDADIDAAEAWDIVNDCSDVIVGVVDDGLDITHVDLASNVWTNPDEIPNDGIDNDGNGYVDDVYGYDFADKDNNILPDVATDDQAGHGTHVAGIIGAKGNNTKGITGVCWDVKIVTLKVFDKFGVAFKSDIIKAAKYAVDLKEHGVNIKILNLSLGGKQTHAGEFEAMKDLREAGILVVAAAGNTGLEYSLSPRYPAGYPLDNIISVAASNGKDRLASFSTYSGDAVDLAAPGNNIVSTVVGNRYEAWDGTSMATPLVSGVAALLAADEPSSNFAELRAKILSGADKLQQLKGKVATGARLNAYGALNASPALPELSIVRVSLLEVTDSNITIKIVPRNGGTVISDTSTVKLYRVTNDADLSLIDVYSVGSLQPDEKQIIITTIALSDSELQSSKIRIMAVIDEENYVYEEDETNNSLVKKILFSTAG